METQVQKIKTLTEAQISAIAVNVSDRWQFTNYGSYYNITDTKTGQRSNDGGDRNFASYNLHNSITSLYLKAIGETYSYLDWQVNGVAFTNEIQAYLFRINLSVVKILCGYEHPMFRLKF